MNASEALVLGIVRRIAANARRLRIELGNGDLGESARLVGERVALTESLRDAVKVKVPGTDSDNISEMDALIRDIEIDTSRCIGSITQRRSELADSLKCLTGEKSIAAYKIQGGRNGY